MYYKEYMSTLDRYNTYKIGTSNTTESSNYKLEINIEHTKKKKEKSYNNNWRIGEEEKKNRTKKSEREGVVACLFCITYSIFLINSTLSL